MWTKASRLNVVHVGGCTTEMEWFECSACRGWTIEIIPIVRRACGVSLSVIDE